MSHSLYFLRACLEQGGISKPLIVLLHHRFASYCFLVLCVLTVDLPLTDSGEAQL